MDNFNLSYANRMASGVLLLLNAPKLMQFGINLSNWTIGAKFMGIKLIPKGIHYISYALHDEKYESKQGFFIYIDEIKQRNIIRQWSDKYQRFIPLKSENDKNYQIGLDNLDFDQHLGDYPIQQHNDWKDLSAFINQSIIDKIDPITMKYLTIENEYESKETTINDTITYYFTQFNTSSKVYSLKRNVDRNQLTNDNIDKSGMLKEILLKEYKDDIELLLGELQYAFVVFFIGESYEGLVQWKNIVTLIMSCKQAIISNDKLYCNFIEVLYHQLLNFPQDTFQDTIIGNNFLRRCFQNFLLENNTYEYSQPFVKRVKLFIKFLKEKFNYNLHTEEEIIINNYLNHDFIPSEDIEDELPVIVPQDEIDESLSRINNQMDLD